MRLLPERLTAVAEKTLIKGVESNHWDPIGSALIVDRLDRLVELAEQLISDRTANHG
ncbi:hypothetical protein [Streptomyces sp. NBC_01361]|uniref:hypothetical protein n=1 Tax=Streptomyces sp. NBC_01361 TaxID=2903838 RepID=UPI002E374212|nr:hypothetical protein [Streptomyces sp. NBC_01361]